MDEQGISEIFEQCGVVVDGHFILVSGRHSDRFVNKNAIYPHVKATKTLSREIALRAKSLDPDVVVGPTTGGIILSQWVAHHLIIELGREVLAVYAERVPGTMRFGFKRGHCAIIKNKRVLVVDDILTTGLSVGDVISATRNCGGEVVGVGVLCNRGRLRKEDLDNAPTLFSLLELPLQSWEADKCPLCRTGTPISTEFGRAC